MSIPMLAREVQIPFEQHASTGSISLVEGDPPGEVRPRSGTIFITHLLPEREALIEQCTYFHLVAQGKEERLRQSEERPGHARLVPQFLEQRQVLLEQGLRSGVLASLE